MPRAPRLLPAFALALLAACSSPRARDPGDAPSAAPASAGENVAPTPTAPRVIGYFTNWAHTRKAPCDFRTSDVDVSLFTHINYAFASVRASEDRETYELVGSSPEDEARLYAEVVALKQKKPGLEVLLSVGGWAFNDEPTAWIFSALAETPERRRAFAAQAARYLRAHGFDGLDIDWEFPGASERGGRPVDTQNFTALLRDVRAEFRREARETGKKELLLTIAAPAGPFFYRGYELTRIHEPLDWINVMTYDYHGEWDSKTGANAPLVDRGSDMEESVAAYLAAGTPRGKLVLGFATYARVFGGVTQATPGGAASGKGPDGPCGPESLGAHHVKQWIEDGRFQGAWDPLTQTPYAYSAQDQAWVTYDDERSYALKLELLARESLGGAMFWAVDLDDVKAGYPLISQVSRAVLGQPAGAAGPAPAD